MVEFLNSTRGCECSPWRDWQDRLTVVQGAVLDPAPVASTVEGVDASTQMSRDDLAELIVAQIDDTTYVHQMPFVSA